MYLRFLTWFRSFRSSHHSTGEALATLTRHFGLLLSNSRQTARSAPFVLPMGPISSVRALEHSTPGLIQISPPSIEVPTSLSAQWWSLPQLPRFPPTPLSRSWSVAPGGHSSYFTPRSRQSPLPVSDRTPRSHSLLDM